MNVESVPPLPSEPAVKLSEGTADGDDAAVGTRSAWRRSKRKRHVRTAVSLQRKRFMSSGLRGDKLAYGVTLSAPMFAIAGMDAT